MGAGKRIFGRGPAAESSQGPRCLCRLIVELDGSTCWSQLADEPDEVLLEATDVRGELAGWWAPEWWDAKLSAWRRPGLRLVLLPTRDALRHKAVLEQLARVRQSRPYWRIVGCTDGAGLASTSAVHELLIGPYDELRFLVPAEPRAFSTFAPEERFASRISLHVAKDLVELREARGLTRPAIVWVCGDDWRYRSEHDQMWLRQTARQIGVDVLSTEECIEFQPWVSSFRSSAGQA